MKTLQSTANFFHCTIDQLKAQYKANAESLTKLRIKAEKTGKKVNGFTLIQLIEAEKKYYALAK